jgi:hypothetical protein
MLFLLPPPSFPRRRESSPSCHPYESEDIYVFCHLLLKAGGARFKKIQTLSSQYFSAPYVAVEVLLTIIGLRAVMNFQEDGNAL